MLRTPAPLTGGAAPKRADIVAMVRTASQIITVDDATDRATVLAELAGIGWTPTADDPVWIRQKDTPGALWVSEDGSAWQRVGLAPQPGSPQAINGTYSGQPLRPAGGLASLTTDSNSLAPLNLDAGYSGLLAVTVNSTANANWQIRVVTPSGAPNIVQVVIRVADTGSGVGAGAGRTVVWTALGW